VHDLWHRAFRVGLATLLLVSGTLALAQAPKPAAAAREDITIDPESIMKPWTGDLDQMVGRRIVRVLVVPSKTYYFNDKGRQRGATYDAFQLVEQELVKELKKSKKLTRKHLKPQFFFVPVGRDEIFSALIAGKGDIAAANLSITPQRAQIVDFATPHTSDVHEVVLTGPASPAVSTLDDLAGKEVFVRKSSSYYEYLVELNSRFAAEKKPLVKLKEAPDDLEDEDLIEMLNAGLVPMLVVDKHIADFWKKVFPKITVHDAITVHAGGEIAWAMRKDSPQLKGFLDRVVAQYTSGHLADERQQILARYFKRTTHVKSAAAEAERKKFLQMVDLFRKYGDRYDVDWMLMAAQGYQESRLNQQAVSPVGAIGVMQVMPTTARDKAVNIPDITKLENNIHAGIKYNRWMEDNFYNEPGITPGNKALFAFASYNAGPGRVASLRKEAKAMGLDPNKWFNNVELVAAKRIGRETVTYVANIYKYYLAYQLMLPTGEAHARAKARKKG